MGWREGVKVSVVTIKKGLVSFVFLSEEERKGKRREGRGERAGAGVGVVGGETVKQTTRLSSQVSFEATQVPQTKLCKLYPGFTKILPHSLHRF